MPGSPGSSRLFARSQRVMRHRIPSTLLGAVLLAALSLVAIPATAGGPVVVGQPVQFQDLSLNLPLSWGWDFDYDGGPEILFDSFEEHPTWTFQEVGSYDVYHQACNFFGCAAIVKTVEVVEDPTIFWDDFETGGAGRWDVESP